MWKGCMAGNKIEITIPWEKHVLYLAQVPTKGMSNDPKAVSCTSICCHGSRVYPRVAPVTNGICFGPSDFLELAAQLHQTLRSCQGYAITYHVKLPEFMVYITKLLITFQLGGWKTIVIPSLLKMPMTVFNTKCRLQRSFSSSGIFRPTGRNRLELVRFFEQSGVTGKLLGSFWERLNKCP